MLSPQQPQLDMDVSRASSTAALSTKSTSMTSVLPDSSDEDEFIALRVAQRVNSNDEEPDSRDSSPESPDEDYDTDYESWDEKEGFPSSVEEIEDQQLLAMAEEDYCTLTEARDFRILLRNIGPEKFCQQTVEAGKISAKKLLTAFGLKPPPRLEGHPDESYYGLLSLGIAKELRKRVKLQHFNTIEDAVELIKKSHNIIVLTGAGISTSLGIPDFRSANTGLYSKLERLGLPIKDPQQVFDINIFKEEPSIFYSVAKDILPDGTRYTPTHKFVYLLQQKGKLLTNYTQNIDDIETAAGILPEKLIQCHGSFATATCTICGYKAPMDQHTQIYKDIKNGLIPRCNKCMETLRTQKAPSMKRKRSANGPDKKRTKKFNRNSDTDDEDDYDDVKAGLMKPDITFFGEALPDVFSERLTRHDKPLVDLVIVIGTSLVVAPVSEIIPYLPAHIPQMYISRESVSHVNFDIDMLGDCDVVVAELCRRAGWDLDHEMVPKGQIVDVELEPGFTSRHVFKVRN